MKKVSLILLAFLLAWTASAQSTQKISTSNNYGANIFRLYILNAFEYGGVGLGAGYERILGNEGKVGINIPLQFGMQNTYTGRSNQMDYSFLLNPGVKFYPMGQRKVTYGLGMSIFYLQGTQLSIISFLNTTQDFNANQWRAGLLIDNSVQFNISPKLNFGLSLGVGPSYLNRSEQYDYSTNRIKTVNEGIQFMANFGLHLGFRI